MVEFAKKYDIPQQLFWLHGPITKPPVAYDPATESWNVHGYQEALDVFGDPVAFSSDTIRLIPEELTSEGTVHLDGFITQMDPPEHGKLRKLAGSAFTRTVIADLEPRIAALTGELLDAARERGGLELVADLAYPLPVVVIAELLGVPASDRELFKRWADMLFLNNNPSSHKDVSDARKAEARTSAGNWQEMADYLAAHAAERRLHPRADLLTQLVEAEVDGERLPGEDVVNFAIVLLLAGHITTTLLLGNTVLCLDAYPEYQERARTDRSTIPAVIEESLRLLTPFAMMARSTTRTIEIGGATIPPDEMVTVWLAAANRDPRVFAAPELFDLGRATNPHLAFGRGIHFCLGAPLARLEGRIALNLLFDRYGDLRVNTDQGVEFLDTSIMTGVGRLPLA
ncbi:cytochrome P450 [Nonomuraea sp. NPDC055795]